MSELELTETDDGWTISGELTDRDKKRMGRIRFRRSNNNLYFSAFETKEEAYLCLKKFAKQYRHTELHENTVKDLCEQYQDKGIMLYPTQTGRWMKDAFNIDVKYTGAGEPRGKITTTITFDKDLKDKYLDQLVGDGVSGYKRSWFINTLLKKHCGMDTPEVLVFMDGKRIDPDTKQKVEQIVSVLFFEEKGEVRALHFGEVETETKKVMELLARIFEEDGREKMIQRTKSLGYFVI